MVAAVVSLWSILTVPTVLIVCVRRYWSRTPYPPRGGDFK